MLSEACNTKDNITKKASKILALIFVMIYNAYTLIIVSFVRVTLNIYDNKYQ